MMLSINPGGALRHLSTTIFLLIALLCCSVLLAAHAQAARQMEYLDRGVVAIPCCNGAYVGCWLLDTVSANISFNIYRNGTRLNSTPITNSTICFDSSGSTTVSYTVRAVVNGSDTGYSAAGSVWGNPYL